MLTKNILPHQMHRRPILVETAAFLIAVTERRDVIRERVQPNVHHMSFIAWDRHAPRNGFLLAADRKVLQSSFDKRDDLVSTSFGPDPLRLLSDYVQQSFVIIREPKEIAFFRNFIEWTLVDLAQGNFRVF